MNIDSVQQVLDSLAAPYALIGAAINETSIRIPRIADLILLKLAAGGYVDLHDAAALLTLGDRDAVIRDVEAHIDDVRPDVRGTWNRLRAAT